MNKEFRPISNAHVHAYVDDELNQNRREVVEDYIVSLPIKCAQVRAYRKINELLRQSFNVDQIPYKHRNIAKNTADATSNFRLVRKQKTVMLIGIMLGLISGWVVINTVSVRINDSLPLVNPDPVNHNTIKPDQSTIQDILHILK